VSSNPLEIGERNREIITTRLVGVLVKILKVRPEQVQPESRLTLDLRADSLDLAELAAELEDEFQVKVEEADVYRISTVAEVVDYVGRLQRAAGQG
jgi:acyl carrier protein